MDTQRFQCHHTLAFRTNVHGGHFHDVWGWRMDNAEEGEQEIQYMCPHGLHQINLAVFLFPLHMSIQLADAQALNVPGAKRRVLQYGSHVFDFTSHRDIKLVRNRSNDRTPSAITELRRKVRDATGIDLPLVMVNFYEQEEGIGSHRDDRGYGGLVAVVSVGGPTTLTFTSDASSRIYRVELPSRSLFVFSDSLRYRWDHHISRASTRSPRTSFTFRSRDCE